MEEQRDAEEEGVDGWENEPYFKGYESMDLHKDMVGDRARNEVYESAIRDVVRDKTVMDVGCGTGLLSFMSARWGAKRVYAVEKSDMAYHAYQTAIRNGLDERVHVTQSRVEELEIQEQVDVIVSEWMGSFLFFEGMLDSVLSARDRHLRPGGTLLPNKCNLFAVPVCLNVLLEDLVGWWATVEGFDYSVFGELIRKQLAARPVHNRAIKAEARMSTDERLCHFELQSMKVQDMERIEQAVVWKIERSGVVHAICLHFDVIFPNGNVLSTAPQAKETHWKQELLILDEDLCVETGDELQCQVSIDRNRYWRRHFVISLVGRLVRNSIVQVQFEKSFPHHRFQTKNGEEN